MRQVREILLQRSGMEMETNPLDAHVLLLYMRVVSSFAGVSVLVGFRLASEALILTRQMFTDSLRLLELSRRGPNRSALILEMIYENLREWENLDKKARNLGATPEGDSRVVDHVAKQREEVEAYRRRHQLKERERFRSEKQLADEHGRLDEYMDFEFTHRIVHQPFISQLGRLEKGPEQDRIHLQTIDDRQLANVCAIAMTSALHAHKAAATIFGWLEPPQEQIDSLFMEIEKVFASGSDRS